MPVANVTVAAIFDEIADLLDVQGANPFRIRAYRNAARTVSELGTELECMLEQGQDLTELPGIGEDLSARIIEIVSTGRCQLLERLHREVPVAVSDLLHLPGLGPRRVKRLWQELDVHSVEQLLRAGQDGRIRALPGFGAKTEQKILTAAAAYLGTPRRWKLGIAARYGEAFCAALRKLPGVGQVALAGSLRRMRDTVGDLDVLVCAANGAGLLANCRDYPGVREVLSSGTTRASLRLDSGMQVDIRVVAPDSYGAALQYFTGSKAHNIALRRLARERGLKVNEYGVFRGRQRIAGESEESVYAAVDLPWIPPELREDRGELEMARERRLPRLVELTDLRGDLHVHSSHSDGHDSIEAMARAALARGLSYIAMTDHSRRLTVAHGLDPAALRKQRLEIARVNRAVAGVTVLSGIEVDILDDGTLDLPDSILAELDIVVAAVHSRFDLSRARQTERILTALKNPHVSLLAHPTGRLLATREPYDVDMLKIIRQARALGVALEVNAHPERLDLQDIHCQMARDEGVKLAINSDAHSTLEFDVLRFGIGQARRGWLTADDVLNSRPLPALRRLLAARRS